MTRAEAEAVYDKMSPADKRLAGIVGVLYSFDIGLLIFRRLNSVLLTKVLSVNPGSGAPNK